MTLDADCVRVHELYALAGRPPLETLSAVDARDAMQRGRAILQPDPPDMAEVRQLTCPGPGGALPLRLYRPKGTAKTAVLPALVYFHGGGWVIGDLDTHDTLCRELANGSGAAVVSVDYRLAPEHPFPAPVDDAFAATKWIAANAPSLGVDANRIAVGGDSAGGNLAIVVALMARDAGGPKLRFQLLIYPATDFSNTQISYEENGGVLPLTTPVMLYFKRHYVGHLGQAAVTDWRASPLSAPSVKGLPPALVMTAGYDVLRDEGQDFADRLESAGIAVERRHYPGQIHGFITMGRIIREANVAVAEAAAAVKAALG